MRRTCVGLSMALMMILAGGGLRAQRCAEGDCVDGAGTMTWPDGGAYTGQWKNGSMDGTGTMTWKDGKRYRGSWKNGLFHGWGALGWPSGEWYEGFFSGGKMDGTGTMRWKNGDRYSGQWKYGAMHGTGTMRYAGGRTVTGTWNNGRPLVEKPAGAGDTAMAGAWRIMCKCFPGPESPYNCPSTSFVFRADGGGTFEERRNSGAETGTIRWTLKGSALTITRYAGKKRAPGRPLTFTYNPAKKWYASKPALHGPEGKIMSYCVIKKVGTK